MRFFAVAYFLGWREEACAQDKSTNDEMCERDSTFSCRFYRTSISRICRLALRRETLSRSTRRLQTPCCSCLTDGNVAARLPVRRNTRLRDTGAFRYCVFGSPRKFSSSTAGANTRVRNPPSFLSKTLCDPIKRALSLRLLHEKSLAQKRDKRAALQPRRLLRSPDSLLSWRHSCFSGSMRPALLCRVSAQYHGSDGEDVLRSWRSQMVKPESL